MLDILGRKSENGAEKGKEGKDKDTTAKIQPQGGKATEAAEAEGEEDHKTGDLMAGSSCR